MLIKYSHFTHCIFILTVDSHYIPHALRSAEIPGSESGLVIPPLYYTAVISSVRPPIGFAEIKRGAGLATPLPVEELAGQYSIH